jgi:hypothetical protein
LDELIKDYKNPEDLIGENGLLKQLTKALIERAMQAEMTHQLGYIKNEFAPEEQSSRRNGSSSKKVRSSSGGIEIAVPRDREGEYEPIIVPKHQRRFDGKDREHHFLVFERLINQRYSGSFDRDLRGEDSARIGFNRHRRDSGRGG